MRWMLIAGLFVIDIGTAWGWTAPQPTTPLLPGACESGIVAAEQSLGLPMDLLSAIAKVESGRRDPASGAVHPWPWTINVEGTGYLYASKLDAIAAVEGHLARGSRSIDIGCMQINLQQHPDAFTSLNDAFDPATNVAYGARFIDLLHRRFGNWPQAIAAYHSQTPEVGKAYLNRVMTRWPLGVSFDGAARWRDRRTPTPDSGLTPEFATVVRRADEDRARLDAALGGGLGPSRLVGSRVRHGALPGAELAVYDRTWPRQRPL